MDTPQLAQINVARLRAPIDDPMIKDFVDQLDSINALAEASPGFVWRLMTENGDATSIVAFDDPRLIVNMSIWRNPQLLRDYVYKSAHIDVLKRRNEWFVDTGRARLALWWVPAGHRPDVAEAEARLELIDRHGPGPRAFTIARTYLAPFDCSDFTPISCVPGLVFHAPAIGDREELVALLSDAQLPIDDLQETSWEAMRSYFLCVRDPQGRCVGAGALEPAGNVALLRSVVVAPAFRGKRLGQRIVQELERLAIERGIGQAYLLTESAAPLFEGLDYLPVSRDSVPEAIARTPQFAGLCPDSAICMTINLADRNMVQSPGESGPA